MSPTARLPRRERRAQLLALATEVFTRQGFQGTSMDDIAAAAGVTKPVLYQHFASKEALYSEVIAGLGDTVVSEVHALADFRGSPEERVRHGLNRFYELVALQDALRLFTGRSDVSDAVQRQVDETLDRAAVALAGVLMTFRRISDEEARSIGRALIVLTQTTATLLHEAPDEEAREGTLATMTRLLLQGLSGFQPTPLLLGEEEPPPRVPEGSPAGPVGPVDPEDAEVGAE